MPTIPASQIVNVLPNVLSAGGSALDLIGLFVTNNSRVPIGTVPSFPTATTVGAYFGYSSTEYALAQVYFKGYDNSTVKPGALLFAQYPQTAVAAYLRSGTIAGMTLSAIQALSGTLTVNIDGYARTASSLSLASATSFSAAAALIQSALNTTPVQAAQVTGSITGTTLTVTAVTSGTLSVGQALAGTGVTAGTTITALGTGTGLTGTYTVSNSQTVSSTTLTASSTNLVVSYDAISGSFIITSGVSGAASTSAFATGTLATPLLLTSATGAVLSQGSAALSPAAFMNGVIAVTQNWATFTTTYDPDGGSGNAVKLAFAAWNNAPNGNLNDDYAYIAWDSDLSPTVTVPATQSLGYLVSQNTYTGTAVIYSADATYAAFACGTGAATNYNARNGRITFAFKSQSGLIANVTNANVATNLIANGYNFYGAYATANQNFVFLNPGKVSGSFLWLDSYVNQIWLNNGLQLALMNLLINAPSIPYNADGYALIAAAVADPINAALNFGAIRAGVTLSQSQIAYVNSAAGKNVAPTLQAQGWYFLIQDASPQVRAARQSPPCSLFYLDGQSIQKIDLASIDVL